MPSSPSTLRTIRAELCEALATIGLRRTCVVVWARTVDAWFDRRNGLETAQRVWLETLGIPSENKPHGSRYQPTSIPALRALLRSLELPRDAAFVDYGCGKGRVLLLAAEIGFTRVVGVEFSPDLCRIARENAARYRARRTGLSPIEVVEADAARWEPPGDARIFYFFHPFDETIVMAAVARILESLRRSPREATLIYNLPRHRAAVDAYPELSVVREMVVGGYPCLVYRYRPA